VSNAELKVTSGVEKSDCDRVSHMQFNVVHKEMSLTFDDVADFVRACARVPVKRPITPETQFERDLGITGDDGSELLEAAEEHFAVNLAPDEGGYRATFGLGPNEYLFNAEGTGLGAASITLFSSRSVRSFTVGELYQALVEVQRRQLQQDGSA
jgi:hypothetical protein